MVHDGDRGFFNELAGDGRPLLALTAALVLGLSALAAAPQVPVSPSPAEVEDLVTKFFVTARHYQRTFRNLVGDETRVNEELSRSGGIRRRRELVSDLLVYRPMRATDEEEGIEYRDVRVVDGKPIDKRGTRALDLITRAMSAKSLEEELRLINRESIRYDFDRHVGGFTISQLSRRTMREDSRFSWAGRDQVDGHDVVSLEYRQVVPREIDPGISDLYRRMGVTSFFERGRVWLDATTYQVRRSRWELAGVHPLSLQPILLVGSDSTYVESRFDILVPQRIVFEWYEGARTSTVRPDFTLVARTTFTYGAFKRFDVETRETVTTP